jgi:hypothetical protein
MRFVLFMLIVLLSSTAVHAKIRTVGKGDRMNFDPATIPANLKPAFDIMSTKCKQCHSLERVVVAVTSGVAPVTGQPFDKQATKSYGIKMLRKPKSNMTREEIKQTIALMNFLLDEAARP